MTAVLTDVSLSHRKSLIWSVMQIVRDSQAAEDVAQETFIGSVANFNYGQNNRWSGRRLPGSFTVFETLSEQRYSLRQRARSDAKSPFNDACFSTDVAC